MLNLGPKFYLKGKSSPKLRLIDMFHAGTPEQVKEFIISETAKEESYLRVLICTIAFGMGVACKSFNRVVHFEPSKNLESYIQEYGRAGRDGKDSTCHLIYNGLLSCKSSDDMKEFIYTKDCRRECIAKNFVASFSNDLQDTCSCCDNCAKNCSCGAFDNCLSSMQLSISTSTSASTDALKTRDVTPQQKSILKQKLNNYKEEYCKSIGQKVKPISCPGIFVQFSDFQVHQVLDCCAYLFTFDDVMEHIEIWHTTHAQNILTILSEVFGDVESNVSGLTFEFIDNKDEEIEHDWLELRDDSHFSVELDSYFLQDVDEAMDDFDKSDQYQTNVTDILGSSHIKTNILNVDTEDMDIFIRFLV